MQVRLMPPFGDNTWKEIRIDSEMSVPDFLARIADIAPRMGTYLRDTTDETFHHLILLRGDYVLESNDTISPSDRITVVMPMTGG
jgi:hypothetical protein